MAMSTPVLVLLIVVGLGFGFVYSAFMVFLGWAIEGLKRMTGTPVLDVTSGDVWYVDPTTEKSGRHVNETHIMAFKRFFGLVKGEHRINGKIVWDATREGKKVLGRFPDTHISDVYASEGESLRVLLEKRDKQIAYLQAELKDATEQNAREKRKIERNFSERLAEQSRASQPRVIK